MTTVEIILSIICAINSAAIYYLLRRKRSVTIVKHSEGRSWRDLEGKTINSTLLK